MKIQLRQTKFCCKAYQTLEKGLHILASSIIVGAVWNKFHLLQDITESTEWKIPDKLASALALLDTFKC